MLSADVSLLDVGTESAELWPADGLIIPRVVHEICVSYDSPSYRSPLTSGTLKKVLKDSILTETVNVIEHLRKFHIAAFL